MKAGAGFMALDSNQEKVAAILLEYEETKKALALLSSEAHRTGDVLQRVELALRRGPESLYVSPGGAISPSIQESKEWSLDTRDIERLAEIIAKSRELTTKMNRLKDERASLGYPV